MTKAIIFDFWGVFFNDPFWSWLRRIGINVDDPALKETFSELARRADMGELTPQQYYQAVSEKTGVSADQILPDWERHMVFNKELVDYVQELHKTYKTAIISNSNGLIDKTIAQYKLAPYFDQITISHQVKLIKPDPKIFEFTLDKLSVKAEEAIFVDDNSKNVEAAQALGVQGIVFTTNENLKKDLSMLSA